MGSGRGATIEELQRKVRETGSFIDRALVREMKVASELFPESHAAWNEVRELADRWEKGAADVKVLEAIRRINRSASCWKTTHIKSATVDLLPRNSPLEPS